MIDALQWLRAETLDPVYATLMASYLSCLLSDTFRLLQAGEDRQDADGSTVEERWEAELDRLLPLHDAPAP